MKQLVLESGRRVSLAPLHQEPTYAGVLAGKPAQHLNEIIIEDIVDGARQYSVAEPILVSPSFGCTLESTPRYRMRRRA